MKIVRAVFVVVVVLLLGGCAATVKRAGPPSASLQIPPTATSTIYLLVKSANGHERSEDWEVFRAEWRTAMGNAATAAGRRFVHLDTLPSGIEEPATVIVLDVNDYRYLSAGARYGFGVMTGNAYIDADANFIVAPEMRQIGTRQYATSSTAWQGVFSAMTSKQVAAIAEQMLKDIDSR